MAKPNKIVHLSLDGDPAILATYSDGRGYAFVHDKEWRKVNASDAAHNGAVMPDSDFAKRWPDIGLPAFPE